MKYHLMFHTNVDLLDVDTVINYVDQGWIYGSDNAYQSLVVKLERVIDVEADSDDKIRQYANSINSIAGINKYVEWICCVDDDHDVDFELAPKNWGK